MVKVYQSCTMYIIFFSTFSIKKKLMKLYRLKSGENALHLEDPCVRAFWSLGSVNTLC